MFLKRRKRYGCTHRCQGVYGWHFLYGKALELSQAEHTVYAKQSQNTYGVITMGFASMLSQYGNIVSAVLHMSSGQSKC